MRELIICVSGVFDGVNAAWGFTASELREGEDMGEVHNQYGLAPAYGQHVGAELKAVMSGVLWGTKNGYDSFIIVYRYEGVAAWIDGTWKAKKEMPVAYQNWMHKKAAAGANFSFARDTDRTKTQWAELLASYAIKEVMQGK